MAQARNIRNPEVAFRECRGDFVRIVVQQEVGTGECLSAERSRLSNPRLTAIRRVCAGQKQVLCQRNRLARQRVVEFVRLPLLLHDDFHGAGQPHKRLRPRIRYHRGGQRRYTSIHDPRVIQAERARSPAQ